MPVCTLVVRRARASPSSWRCSWCSSCRCSAPRWRPSAGPRRCRASTTRRMSQARYGGGVGLHSAANYLIHTYAAAGRGRRRPAGQLRHDHVAGATYERRAGGADDGGGRDVELPGRRQDRRRSRNNCARRTDDVGHRDRPTRHARRCCSMRQFPDAYSGGNVTIQTWRITGVGDDRRRRRRGGAGERDHRDAGGAGLPLRGVCDQDRLRRVDFARRRLRPTSYDSQALDGGNPVDAHQPTATSAPTAASTKRWSQARRSSTATCRRHVPAWAPAATAT